MRIRCAVVLVVAGAVTLGSVAAPRLKEPADARLPGTWRQVHAEFDGVNQTARNHNHWVITGATITIFMEGANRGQWTYRLDPSKTPAEIDLTSHVGQTPVTYPCIYKLDGDKLTLCLQNFPGRGRPKNYETSRDSGIVKYVYVRARPGDEKAPPPIDK